MRIVLQRVRHCTVSVDATIVGSIGTGILIFLGVDKNDSCAQADHLAEKCAGLRIFGDDSGKMNLCATDIGAQALVVSQFTLLGDCTKGKRPNFTRAAGFEKGKQLYEYFVESLRRYLTKVETGVFGAMMDVALVNDGPVTILLEKENENDRHNGQDSGQA